MSTRPNTRLVLLGMIVALGCAFLPTAHAASSSYIVISFADGFDGTMVYGYPALMKYGWRAVALIPTARVGRIGHMSLGHLSTLDTAGWDVSSHLDNEGDPTQMPTDELRRRLAISHDWLASHGFAKGARTFGPPGQKWQPSLTPLALAAKYQVILVRADRGGIVPHGLTYKVRGCGNAVPLDKISQAISQAVSQPGTLLDLSFHDIVPSGPTGTDADIVRLNQVLALVAQSQLPVVTFSDLLDR